MPSDKDLLHFNEPIPPDAGILQKLAIAQANAQNVEKLQAALTETWKKVKEDNSSPTKSGPPSSAFQLKLEDLVKPSLYGDEWLEKTSPYFSSKYSMIAHPSSVQDTKLLKHKHTKHKYVLFEVYIPFKNAAVKSQAETIPSAPVAPALAAPAILKPECSWNGSFENVVFVTECRPSDRLCGDARLAIDLGARLSNAMNVAPRYIQVSDLYPADFPDRHHLYVTVNCDGLPPKYPRASLAISNDIDYHARTRKTDFRFEPSFNRTFYEHKPEQRAFAIDTLPSRITPELIAEAASKNEQLTPDGKPLIVIMLRAHGCDQLQSAMVIAQSLAHKHGARFALCTGPNATSYVDASIDGQSWDQNIPGILKFPWHKQPNPYLALLGAATHFVTSGTLSTTSDLLATGKPIYYMDDGLTIENYKIVASCNGRLRKKLFDDKAVQHFSHEMLDVPPPDQAIRTRYAQEWGRVSAEFVRSFASHLKERYAPDNPGFERDFMRSQAMCG